MVLLMFSLVRLPTGILHWCQDQQLLKEGLALIMEEVVNARKGLRQVSWEHVRL